MWRALLVASTLLLLACGGKRAGVSTTVESDAATGDASSAPAVDSGALVDSSMDLDVVQVDAAPAPEGAQGASCGPGPSTCTGCCTVDGQCVTLETNGTCGTNGEACAVCASGESCTDGACVRPQVDCNPSNCGGCCVGDSACADGTQNTACGQSGAVCAPCDRCFPTGAGGGTCSNTSCNGCSTSYGCANGMSQNQCGIHGEPCHVCTNGQQCAPAPTAGGICQDAGTCGPANCPGCCDGTVCLYGDQGVACGAGGSVCANCTMYGWTCSSGACL